MNGIRHTGIYVKDLEKMISFYKDIFDLDIVVRQIEKGIITDVMFAEPDVVIDVCKMKFRNGSMLELIHHMKDSQNKSEVAKIYSTGKMHIAITVDSTNYIHEKLIESGCKVLSEPCRSADGKVKVFFAQDPEDNYLEIVEEI